MSGTAGPFAAAQRREAARAALTALTVDVPDFPEAGVVFKDLTPVFGDAAGLAAVVAALADAGRDGSGGTAVDVVVGLEARGFILGAPVALALGVGFVPVRKAGKLPRSTHAVSYALEYGTAEIEVHRDSLAPGSRVLVIDDVLATGGTAAAACDLVRASGAVPVALAVLLELGFLAGRERLDDLPVHAVEIVA